MTNKEVVELIEENNALKQRVLLLEKWMDKECIGDFFTEFVEINQLKRIGVYGCGKYGKILLNQLRQCGTNYICGIDSYCDKRESEYPIFNLDNTPELDMVIISTIGMPVQKIKEIICSKDNSVIVTTLDEVLDCSNTIELDEE